MQVIICFHVKNKRLIFSQQLVAHAMETKNSRTSYKVLREIIKGKESKNIICNIELSKRTSSRSTDAVK